ncbi:MAG: tRNA pseudouridine(54/55) synthase Pus10 [Candidatus Aenigmarchaeota archaeon]|nr:tRNA pseudouridine(54/55) synthase Pus10 [Candidatus Aenigmarchaeota archaeon]
MKMEELVREVFKEPMCDNCAGRTVGNLLSGFDNKQRGNVLRTYAALLLDSGEKLDLDPSNFHGMKFRNIKLESKQQKCKLCKNFFSEKINELSKSISKKLDKIEFNTFLVGSVPSHEMLNDEEKLQERLGIEFSETIKSEMNRELGKAIEKITGKHFDLKIPDVTIVVDNNTDTTRLQLRSVYISGGYQKLARGIPQTKWTCRNCNGKGCTVCGGEGKLYKTSVQEIIDKPLLKAAGSKESALHAAGREDIDARNLGFRPFVVELIKPEKRKLDLKKLEKEINKSKKVKVKGLKLVGDGRPLIIKLKSDRYEKTYFIDIEFEKDVDKKLLKLVKGLVKIPILQKTPTRVEHRRAKLTRKRLVKGISYVVSGKRRVKFTIRSEAGLYIKELINGDGGKTQPNISDMIKNKVKSLQLDVLKIHS